MLSMALSHTLHVNFRFFQPPIPTVRSAFFTGCFPHLEAYFRVITFQQMNDIEWVRLANPTGSLVDRDMANINPYPTTYLLVKACQHLWLPIVTMVIDLHLC